MLLLVGSLPVEVCRCTRAQNILLNNMRISGSLPECSRMGTRHIYSDLSTLSIARNYFTGSTDSISRSDNLSTLVLASNFFTADMVALDGATGLGSSTPYQDPAELTLVQVGAQVKNNATRSPGNPRLRTQPVIRFAWACLNWVQSAIPSAKMNKNTFSAVMNHISFPASNPFAAKEPIRNYSKIVLAFAGEYMLHLLSLFKHVVLQTGKYICGLIHLL